MIITRTDIAPGIFTLAGVLSPSECATYIVMSEEHGFDAAPLNIGGVRERVVEHERNNQRMMLDDPERTSMLWGRVSSHIPAFLRGWQSIGLNERLRFYRYERGQQFKCHQDGSFERANREKSQLTFMIYLNDDFEGGETTFSNATIKPQTGTALVFQHDLLHEGVTVQTGIKYVLRSDVMYGPVGRLYS